MASYSPGNLVSHKICKRLGDVAQWESSCLDSTREGLGAYVVQGRALA